MPPSTPSADLHLQAARDHIAHGDFLQSTGRNDPVTVGWAITALFYGALHAVRAYLKACKDVDVTSHEDFSNHARAYPELKRSQVDYDWLKQESQAARYYCNPNFTWADFVQLRKAANKVLATWEPLAKKCIAAQAAPANLPRG